ncbi:MAG: acetate--CoA ligase family protein [Deltaproteobacteria bacterium]|nr:acetate--CoA ligase family protein [Deltaproteobacteria bacterium]
MAEIIEQLKHVVSPKSVAIVGASSDFSKFTGRTVKYLLKHGYSGTFYPVNPKRKEIAGHRCYPSVKDLPEPVDTVFIQIPARFVPGVLEECIETGVKSAIIHSAGMGEENEEGKKRQDAIKFMAKEAGIRVVGPNCAGIANMWENIFLSPIVCYELDTIPKGRIGLISQSGGLTGAYVARAAARGIGFSHVISTGNEMDLEMCDYIEYLLHDSRTDVVAVFLEALRNGKRFLEIAESATEAGKPIIVLKVGRTRAGARTAASHTGALTGSDFIYNAVFRQKGIIRVEMMEDLFEVSSLFCKVTPPGGNRVGVVTTTGGGAALMVEAGAQSGLDFPMPSDTAVKAASEFLPSFAAKSNPMDVTMAGAGGGFKEGLRVMLDDSSFDMVVGVVGTSSQFAPELGVKPILEVYKDTTKPLVAFCNPNAEEALRLFEANGIPSFRTPEACGRALGYLVTYGKYLEKRKKTTARAELPALKESNQRLVRSILDRPAGILNEYDSKQILSAYGIPITREAVAKDEEEAKTIAQKIGYPVALKVLSSDIPHKTEAGVIKLSIESEKHLEEGFAEVLANAKAFKTDANVEGVLVQQMAKESTGALEAIVGIYRDETFGPALMFGLGGVFVEVFKDVAHRIVPISELDAWEMILETKGAVLMSGYRGKEKMDIQAVVLTLQKVGKLLEDFGDRILELDINPLIVYPEGKGSIAVDALIRIN